MTERTVALILGGAVVAVPEGAVVGRFAAWDDDASAWWSAHLDGARVGWRGIIAGTEPDVAAAQAMARRAGAEPDEVTSIVVDGGVERVYCPLCGAIGRSATCGTCEADLTVSEHFSARHGAFLGIPVT